MRRPTLKGRVEDVEWLLTSGTAPRDVCARVNSTPAAVARMLYRYDRPDLARRFHQLAREQYPRPNNSKYYADTFPRYDPTVREWAVANGYPLASCGRVHKATYTAWEQAQAGDTPCPGSA